MVHITTDRRTSKKTLSESVKFILDLMLQQSVFRVEISSPNKIDLTLTIHSQSNTKQCVLRPETPDERILGKLADAYSRRQVSQARTGQTEVPITPVELAAYAINREGRWSAKDLTHNTDDLAQLIITAIC